MSSTPDPRTPRHIAVIMDGNRRWAKSRGLSPLAGHRRVTDEVIEPLLEAASDRGIEVMTFWAWSTENWGRPLREVSGIMRLFRRVIRRNWLRLHEKGVRIRIIGDIGKFDQDIREGLVDVEEQTKENTRITAVFALNYGGRDELIRAVQRLPVGSRHQVTAEELSTALDTDGIPDPDIIVRTGGEMRLSGFLLWQSEYSELYFPTWTMPEFTPDKLDEILDEYRRRNRRYGR